MHSQMVVDLMCLSCLNRNSLNSLNEKTERLKQATIQKPELVIFDCDGVLVDSEVLSYETYAKVFASENFDITPSDLLDRLSGLSLSDMLQSLKKNAGVTLSSNIKDKLHKAILQRFTRDLRPMPGIIDLLENLTAIPIPFCVASNGSKARITHALTVTGLREYFSDERIFDVSLVKNGKPAPDLFLYAAEKMGIAPNQCLVIEDSVTGIAAAKAAQMAVIGFLGGSHCTAKNYASRIHAAQPSLVVDSIDAVKKILVKKLAGLKNTTPS